MRTQPSPRRSLGKVASPLPAYRTAQVH
jgi:hypothetical protein